MKQPPGFYVKDSQGKVLLLQKSIYGLKQAPRNFFQFLSSTLQELGLVSSLLDPCLFTYQGTDGVIIVSVYVDDLLMGGTAKDKMNSIVEHLKQFRCNNLGEPTQLVGMVVERDRANSTMRLHQEPLIKELVAEFKSPINKYCSKAYQTPADEQTYSTFLDSVFRGDIRTHNRNKMIQSNRGCTHPKDVEREKLKRDL